MKTAWQGIYRQYKWLCKEICLANVKESIIGKEKMSSTDTASADRTCDRQYETSN